MNLQFKEILRYVLNGVIATAVHFLILTVNLNFFDFKSVGLANFIAAIFGITTSFLGSRYYVFKRTTESFIQQALKFSGLYGVIAVLHGLLLFIWSDWYNLDYRFGFVVATFLQISISYLGNKFLVFRT